MKLKGLAFALAVSTLLAASAAAAATTKNGMPLAKDVRAACGKDVKAQGLKGKEASAARAKVWPSPSSGPILPRDPRAARMPRPRDSARRRRPRC